jgi:Zn-dependent protease with chaperone function
MAEQIKQPIICTNGHPQPASNTKFCIFCGTALNVQAVQPNQQNNQNAYSKSPQNAQPKQVVVPTVTPPNNQPQPQFPNQNIQPQAQIPPSFNQNNPNYQQNQYPPPQQFPQNQPQFIQALSCYTCGGDGRGLPEKTVICKECRWLRPLIPGYRVDSSAFAWAADAKAMAALRAMTPLNAAAKAVSEKVGRRWIEVTFNGVRLGEKQMPQIYAQAVKAARILGVTNMPDVYLSGERPWDCLTFGTEKDSFIVIGSALAGNFQGIDMFFLLAREMGHCQAGHALWKTVIRFFLGEQGPAKGFMAGGIFNAILSPTALIGGAIEMPLLAWARQAEITADRAGLLTVGSEDVARRVLLSWSLKSAFLYKQININSWLEQQAETDDGYSRLSELTTTSTPYITCLLYTSDAADEGLEMCIRDRYITPRLKLLAEFSKSPELQYWRKIIVDSIKRSAPPKPTESGDKQLKDDVLRSICDACQTPMQIPLKVLEGKSVLPVKCPNPKCGKITRLKNPSESETQKSAVSKTDKPKEIMNYGD